MSDQNMTHDMIFLLRTSVATFKWGQVNVKRVYFVHIFENVSSSILTFSAHEIKHLNVNKDFRYWIIFLSPQ